MSAFSKLFEKMMGQLEEYRVRQLLRSHFLQPRDERKARMRAIVELSAEFQRAKQTSRFGSAAAESAIEAIIEGDWHRAEAYVADLTFADDPDAAAEYASIWEPFVVTLRAVCAEARRRETGKPSPEN